MKLFFSSVLVLALGLGVFSVQAAETKSVSTQTSQTATTAKGSTLDVQILELSITENGYEPASLNAKPNIPTVLKVTRKTDATCAKKLQIPSKELTVDIPLNSPVTIDLGKLTKGEIKFGCSMGQMVAGVLNVQ